MTKDKKRQEMKQIEKKPRGSTCVWEFPVSFLVWLFHHIGPWGRMYIWITVFAYIPHTPVCVERCDRLSSSWIQRLSLLQQDVLQQSGDVHVDVAGEALHAGRVGSHHCQEVRWTGYLLGGLVVICHSHDDPRETCLTNVTYHWVTAYWEQTDGTLEEVKRAMVVRCWTLVRSAQSLLQASIQFYLFFPLILSPSLPDCTVAYLQFWQCWEQSLLACCYSRVLSLGWQER